MENEVIYARDIDDCSVCPLYEKDCPGGWTSSGGGTPIEPPCTSWNGEERNCLGDRREPMLKP